MAKYKNIGKFKILLQDKNNLLSIGPNQEVELSELPAELNSFLVEIIEKKQKPIVEDTQDKLPSDLSNKKSRTRKM